MLEKIVGKRLKYCLKSQKKTKNLAIAVAVQGGYMTKKKGSLRSVLFATTESFIFVRYAMNLLEECA